MPILYGWILEVNPSCPATLEPDKRAFSKDVLLSSAEMNGVVDVVPDLQRFGRVIDIGEVQVVGIIGKS